MGNWWRHATSVKMNGRPTGGSTEELGFAGGEERRLLNAELAHNRSPRVQVSPCILVPKPKRADLRHRVNQNVGMHESACVLCACVCTRQGLYRSTERKGRHDALWVAAPLRGWPDLCLQLRFTGQQQIGGVIAWQQHSPSLGLTAHSIHTHKHAHAGSTKCMRVGRRKHGSWGNSWNTKCTQMLKNFGTHAQIPREKNVSDQ